MTSAAPSLQGAFAEAAEPERPGTKSRENIWLMAGVLCLALYPFLDQALGIGRLGAWGAIFIYMILAMGLNIVVGYAGLLDLGYAAFFAIGAYTIGILTSPSSYFIQKGWIPGVLQHFSVALLLAWLTAAVFGVLLGAPTLRLRGDYLAIVTLGFGEIVPSVFLNAEKYTAGTRGINPVGKPRSFEVFGHDIMFGPTNQRNWYWLILAVGLLSLLMIRRMHDSRLGRTWMAVREDEIAAASMGVNLVKTKLWAFALGASFAGFAGALYASYFQYVHPSNFQFSVSVTILAMIILGGLGNIYGVVAGAAFIGYFDRVLSEQLNSPLHWLGRKTGLNMLENHDVTQDKFMVFGLALVLMMLWRPAGLFPSARRRAELVPETEDELVQETQSLFDVRRDGGSAGGERA